jgi:hypothetical protein
MKKQILFSLFFFLSMMNLKAQLSTHSLEENSLKGGVKSIRSFTVDSLDSEGNIFPGQKKDSAYILFNSKRNKTEECEYYNTGPYYTGISKNVYSYNSSGKLIGKKKYSDTEMKLRTNFDSQFKYIYDSKGNLIEEKHTQFDGYFLLSIFHTYSSSGILIEKTSCGRPDDIKGKEGDCLIFEEFKYDSINQLIETIYHDRVDVNTYKIIYRYDTNGNLTEMNQSLINEGIEPESDYQFTFKHDENRNETERIMFNARENKTSKINYKYVYDKNGNWIKRIIYLEGQPMEFTERVIKYY